MVDKESGAPDSASHKPGSKSGKGGSPHYKKNKSGHRRKNHHSQRAGADRVATKYGPARKDFREERQRTRAEEPDLPEGIDITDLDPMVLQDIRVLSKDNADHVARHMITAIDLLEDDPQLALRHARAAKNRAGRVGVAREVNGIVAYRAGEWKEALSELRASRRISGGPGLMAVMADCERGLGRPEKAIELARSEEARQLDDESKVELAIVVAGARLDLGQNDSAVATLERLGPSTEDTSLCGLRLCYAYADALAAAGRPQDAKRWFAHVVASDTEETTDARERLESL